MLQTKDGLINSNRKLILQKDLSFSNQIFKRSINMQNIHSSKSSHQNLYQYTNNNINNNVNTQNTKHKNNNSIPALIKYTQSHNKNVVQQQQSILHQHKYNQPPLQQQQQVSIFKQNSQQRRVPKLLSLSKLEQKIAKKYQKTSQYSPHQQINQIPRTTVHYDKQTNQSQLKSSRNKILNIDSLQQSRIANNSIQKHNHWIINNIGDNSGFLQDNNITTTLLTNNNMSKNSMNRRNINNRSLMNNSFRNINPLQLVNNSLHVSNLPEFVQDDDDQLSENNNNQQQQNHNNNNNINSNNNNQRNKQTNNTLKTLQQKLRLFNINNNNNNQNTQPSPYTKQRTDYKKLTMKMYQHYLLPYLNNKSQHNNNDQIMQTNSIPDSILINDFDIKGFDALTTKSTPIYIKSTPNQYNNQRTISEIQRNQHLLIEQNPLQQNNTLQHFITPQQQYKQNHFINNKSPQQIISSVLRDPNKLKLYIKYLQLSIVNLTHYNNHHHHSQQYQQQTNKQQIPSIHNNQNNSIVKNYQLLTCILIQINQITHHNHTQSHTPKTLSQSILNLTQQHQNKQSSSQPSNNKPQIVRSSNTLKINFDPYLQSQTQKINSQISHLKKCLQQKNKETQLIKINYDAIIHNYATTLQNLAKNNVQISQQKDTHKFKQKDNSLESDNYQERQEQLLKRKNKRKSYNYSQKMYLDPNQTKNRSSFESNKIHRKTTFGKVPSSMRGSDIAEQ